MDIFNFIQNLNNDLCGELCAVNAYLLYSASVAGLHRKELSEFFAEEAQEEMEHALFLMNKIVALGGTPDVQPELPQFSTDPDSILSTLLQMESEAVDGYTRRVEEARSVGEIGLAIDLENVLATETKHKEELMKMLS